MSIRSTPRLFTKYNQLPPYNPMDRVTAARLGKTIVKQTPLRVKLSENSQGSWFCHVTDPRDDLEDRLRPFTIRDPQEWDDLDYKPTKQQKEVTA